MPISPAGNSHSFHHGLTSAHGRARRGFASPRRFAEHGSTLPGRFAEHGFTLPRRFAEHGFTLVELMVVITLIALASAVAMLAMPDPRGRVADEATRFAARARAAHDLAIVDARPVSIWVSGGGYGFDRRVAGAWSPIADKPLRVERWGEGVRAATDAPAGRARITYDPTGFADRPLLLTLTRDSASETVALGANGSVRVGG